jgi:hypothetical protein
VHESGLSSHVVRRVIEQHPPVVPEDSISCPPLVPILEFRSTVTSNSSSYRSETRSCPCERKYDRKPDAECLMLRRPTTSALQMLSN